MLLQVYKREAWFGVPSMRLSGSPGPFAKFSVLKELGWLFTGSVCHMPPLGRAATKFFRHPELT